MNAYKRICFLSVLALILNSLSLNAQVRKYSNEFLSLGIGARALAMGNAQVASVSDVTSAYWNPAALVYTKNDLQLGMMHAEYFAGIAKYDYGGIVLPMENEKSFLGLTIIRFAIDDIPNTLFLVEPDGSINYNNISSFSAADYAFLFSYAQLSNIEHLSWGANFKIVHRVVGDFARAWGFGLDASAQYRPGSWFFGAMLRDVTSTFNAWSFSFSDEEKEILSATDNLIPDNSLEMTLPKLIIGAGYEWVLKKNFHIRPELNFNIATDGKRNVLFNLKPFSFDPNIGLELAYKDVVSIRTGLNNYQKATSDFDNSTITTIQPNFGIGLKIKSITIDYALTDVGDLSQSMYSHIFSVFVDINKKNEGTEE